MPKKLTTEEFIAKAKKVHGDTYDYSKVEYKNTYSKVIIICPEHGEFQQRPKSHLKGHDCFACKGTKRLTTEEFIAKAKKVHGDTYNYSKVEYKNTSSKVIIICPEHGEFQQTPDKHLSGSACPACVGKKRLTTEEFIAKAKKIHGDKYDYSKVEYKNKFSKVVIICPEHGEFQQVPHNHLASQGCPACSGSIYKAYKNTQEVLTFLKALKNNLHILSGADLCVLIQQATNSTVIQAFQSLKTSRPNLPTLNELVGSSDPEEVLEDIETQLESEANKLKGYLDSGLVESADKDVAEEYKDLTTAPSDSVSSELKFISSLTKNKILVDTYEALDYFVFSRGNKVINQIICDDLNLQDFNLDLTNDLDRRVYIYCQELLESADNLEIPQHGFGFEFNLMQKIVASHLIKKKRFANFSTVGTGKTASALLYAMLAKHKKIAVITNNSTVNNWKNQIKNVPNSISYTKLKTPGIHNSKNVYNIYNYEMFQQNNTQELIESIASWNPDFIICDEIQEIKSLDAKRRHFVNSLLVSCEHVLGLSATPLSNNLKEFKAVLESITGLNHEELDLDSTATNAYACHAKLPLHSFRYRANPAVDYTEHNIDVDIDASDIQDLQSSNVISALEVEKSLLQAKLTAVQPELQSGSIIYVDYVSDIVNQVNAYIKNLGYSTCLYTGEQKDLFGLEKFKRGKKDILIASRPIAVGVDGLQKVSNRMFLLGLPWTFSSYEQLLGRIIRQGSKFSNVDIYRVICDESNIDSWDNYKLGKLEHKKSLMDAVLDGVIPSHVSNNSLQAESLKSLTKWINNIHDKGVKTLTRKGLKVPLPETTKQACIKKYGDFSKLNQLFSVTSSNSMNKKLQDDPAWWYHYHTLRRESKESWVEFPVKVIADKLTDSSLIIADMGCGEAELRELLPNNVVHSFDHVAINKYVVAANIKSVPLKNNSIDVAVYCQSLLGTDWHKYLLEGYRVLKHGGLICIVIGKGKKDTKEPKIQTALNAIGFNSYRQHSTDYFTYIRANKNLTLNF